ncbi:hypothetical protein ACJX0J_020098, partial [Zea mays]
PLLLLNASADHHLPWRRSSPISSCQGAVAELALPQPWTSSGHPSPISPRPHPLAAAPSYSWWLSLIPWMLAVLPSLVLTSAPCVGWPVAPALVKGPTEGSKISEVLSPSANVETIKNQKVPAVTPKRKRMVNVLDVLETIKSSSTPPKKTVATSEAKTEISDTKAPEQETEAEAGPSEPTKRVVTLTSPQGERID